jgi:3-isopropylmalate/(R)-2-methylmalate dehydratase small subunit
LSVGVALSPHTYSRSHAAFLRPYRPRRRAPSRERGHRPDHPQAVPQAHRAHRIRAVAWRYRADGTPEPAFELNRPEAAGASVLITGANFGCGSSREHAPWALAEYGFRAIVAPSYADIFYNNCCQNGLLPVVLTDADVQILTRRSTASAGGYTVTVDLISCRVLDGEGFDSGFSMDDYRREMLLRGLDEIGKTLLAEERITAFERRRAAELYEVAS